MEGAILTDTTNPQNIVNLTSEEFSVGRSLKCSFVVEDLNVSRKHCEFYFENNKWTLMDKSSNGTKLNDLELNKNTKYDLKDGDLVTLNDRYKYIFSLRTQSSTTDTTTKRRSVENEIPDIENTVGECISVENSDSASSSQEDTPIEVSSLKSENETKKKRRSKRLVKSDDKDDDESEEPLQKKIKVDGEVKLSEEDEELQCSICTELFIKAVTLNCSHTFCKYCVEHWKKSHPECPICRKKIENISPTLIIDNLVEKLVDKCSPNLKERRAKILEERIALAAAESASSEGQRRLLIINLEQSDAEDDDEDEVHWGDGEDFWNYESANEWSEEDDVEDFEFLTTGDRPSPFYGGYGRCYICNETGHWANGCPRRGRLL